ncbi:Metallo-dependent hydrolase [Pisolithus albus]|nr:Metallo-dependent hydrolase [Pisolithus albus]
MATISGASAAALHSLSPSDVDFLQSLPKAELHAHLNGSIPLQTLVDLAHEHLTLSPDNAEEIAETIARLKSGLMLDEISDFFPLFREIYAITSTPSALSRVTRDVLDSFLKAQSVPPAGFTYKPVPECTYIELRTTPRATARMSRYTYLTTVLDEVEKFSADQAALIVSIDRRMSEADAKECVDLAITLRAAGRRVVGLDLCGDPEKGDVATFEKHFKRGKDAGLGVTLHIAEAKASTTAESLALLGWHPERLGHATFLSDEHKASFFGDPCIEICLTSNFISKTVQSLESHHVRYYLANDHPIAICTDDTLAFRTTLLGEYAQLLANPPLGLGLRREQVRRIAAMSMEARFK